MVALNRVSIGVNADPETALYIGQLEGTLAALVVNECKYRVLLELITGEPWDSTKLAAESVDLVSVAADALARQTGVTQEQAMNLVQSRFSGPESQRLPNPAHATPSVNMQERLASWRRRNGMDAAQGTD